VAGRELAQRARIQGLRVAASVAAWVFSAQAESRRDISRAISREGEAAYGERQTRSASPREAVREPHKKIGWLRGA
jgi:hypothetical protein